MRSTIKVLVVDDSALLRQMLTRALRLDPRIEIVGVAKNGLEAIEKARDLNPDVITLDVEMPELSGIEALPHIVRQCSARILMLTSVDDPDIAYQALNSGAVDFICKPREGVATSLNELAETLLKKIKTAYRLDPEHVSEAVAALEAEFIVEDIGPVPTRPAQPGEPHEFITDMDRVVAIAASTGGPPALEHVFSGLEPDLPAIYLVVQHLPAGFASSLARRLTAAGGIEVLEAQEGMALKSGVGYLAPHGVHMIVTKRAEGSYALSLRDTPPLHGVRPAADPLFDSVASIFGPRAMGIVLTGMGNDGARGLHAMRMAGAETLVQDEESSVIWGMPGAAVKLGAARRSVPIGLVAPEIRRFVRGVGRHE